MTQKKPSFAAAVSSTEKKFYPQAALSPVAVETYQQVTKEMIGLWRDQLGRMSQHAERMQKMRDAAAPVFSLYARGVDMWLNLAEAYGRSVWSTMPKASASPFTPPAAFKRPSASKPKAAQEILPGQVELAELARRVAEMERERSTRKTAPGSAKTATVIGFEKTSGPRLTRPSKSE